MIELPWDPEVESPATIAVIGGGPVGIETALYARFLGYFVSIFESRRVGHRMLDWHHRKLAVSVAQCTTPLGIAAIKAQYPDYQIPDRSAVWSGKEYAESYLLPLAKTDLLFDDIHFLSPVSNVSRLRTFRDQPIEPQERCNDEFRLVVEGRHRGTWSSRADIVIDCRGHHQMTDGIGPGGGVAIGESVVKDAFYGHSVLDRKFESKQIVGKHICITGVGPRACQFVDEYLEWYPANPGGRLTWIVPADHAHWSNELRQTIGRVEGCRVSEIQTYELLGIEKIQKEEAGWLLNVLMSDSTAVDFRCDLFVAFPANRPMTLSHSIDDRNCNPEWGDIPDFFTCEPGYYRLRACPLEFATLNDCGERLGLNAGAGLDHAFDSIRKLFAVIVGREELDLYRVMAENLSEGRV
ncbi:MAG: hypothetical protein ACK56W_21545 [Pirellula sp.]|jgi:hypothetical protein|nr:hypothetical protein [Pirellula sp.]